MLSLLEPCGDIFLDVSDDLEHTSLTFHHPHGKKKLEKFGERDSMRLALAHLGEKITSH